MEKQLTSRRLVLVPCPFQWHVTPMLQLGAILHSKGFNITITHTDFDFLDPSNYPNFDFLEMSDGLCEQNISSHNFIDAISGFDVNCKSPLQESLARKMEKEDRNSKISCIIYDEYMYFSKEVANHLGLRSIILTTSSAANMLTHQAIPRLLKHDHIPIQDSMMLELLPGLQLLRFKDLPISNFGGLLHKTVPSPSISLLKEDQSCMSWLDEKAHNSVIYVSLGSIVFMDSKEQEEMAWDLANSEQPFLWVVRTVSLPEGF
ncbi:hypothetical protein C1H46_013421 [Malus baccata]|uniref:UDP-glycosyltransferases domain-containing protein n=1 Tax=Malus baccata TaxID=106549 RepID=A0A540MQ09_MALBA|nr:hypothetical protein C1H46_013421 [Malus baccata]